MEYKSLLKHSVKVILSLVLLYWVIQKVSYKEAIAGLKNVNLYILSLSMIVSTLIVILQAHRWKTLVGVEPKNANFKSFLRYILLGYFYNSFLPIGIGSDILKSFSLGKQINNQKLALSSIFSAKVMGLFVLNSLMWTSILMTSGEMLPSYAYLPLFLFSGLITVSCFFLFISPQLVIKLIPWEKMRQALSYFKTLSLDKLTLVKALGLSFGIQILVSINQLIFFYSVGAEIQFFDNLLYFSLLSMLLFLPISIGGVGLREASSIYLLTRLSNISESHCIQISLLAYLLMIILAVIGGVTHMFQPKKAEES